MSREEKVKLSLSDRTVLQINNLGDMVFLDLGIIEQHAHQALTKPNLDKSLTYMQKRHPLLRAHLSHKSDAVYYVIPDPDNLDRSGHPF
jgi:hypothetical protein